MGLLTDMDSGVVESRVHPAREDCVVAICMLQAGYVTPKPSGRPRSWPRLQLNHELLFKNNYGTDMTLTKTRMLELEHIFASGSRRSGPAKAVLPKLNFPEEPSLAQEVSLQLTRGRAKGEASLSKTPAETTVSGTTNTTGVSSSRTEESSGPSSGTNLTDASMSEASRPKTAIPRHSNP
jgi:hypothetical protein